jgi:hypothetical protein
LLKKLARYRKNCVSGDAFVYSPHKETGSFAFVVVLQPLIHAYTFQRPIALYSWQLVLKVNFAG